MEVRDEVTCVASHPKLPYVAYATRVTTRNPIVDESVMCSHVKVLLSDSKRSWLHVSQHNCSDICVSTPLLQVWDYERRYFVASFGESGVVSSLSFSPNGQLLAVARNGDARFTSLTDSSVHRVALYNVLHGFRLLKTDVDSIEDGTHNSEITCLAFCQASMEAGDKVSWGGTSLAYYNQIKSERARKSWMRPKVNERLTSMDRNMSIIATGSMDGQVRLWDYVTNQYMTIEKAQSNNTIVSVRSVSFSTDGRCLAALYSNNTVVMWSFSKNRPRLPKIDRDLLETKLCAEYEQKMATQELENKLKGKKKKSKAELEEDKEQEFVKIKEFVKNLRDVLPAPPIPSLGFPNSFLNIRMRKHNNEKKSFNTMTVIPGFANPSSFKTKDNDVNFIDEFPPAYPQCELDTKDVLQMYARVKNGELFKALFVTERTQLEIERVLSESFDKNALTIQQRRKLEKELREMNKKAEMERLREQELDAEAIEQSKRMIKENQAAGDDDDDMGLGMFDKEGNPISLARPTELDNPLASQTVAGKSVVLAVDVRVEYLEPLPYPPEAGTQVRTFNIERYRTILSTPDPALIPVEYLEGKSMAVLDPVKFIDDPDPRYREEHRLLMQRGAAPKERKFDLLGELLIRDQNREYLFPLAQLEQIQVGKYSVEHLSSVGARNPANCCMSLIGKEDQLHLVAPNAETLDEWVHVLRYILWRAGRNFAPSSGSEQFLVEVPPSEAYLDVDLVEALNANVSMGLWTLMGANSKYNTNSGLNKKKKTTRSNVGTHYDSDEENSEDDMLEDDNFYFGLDFLDNIFATTCHTYRLFLGGDHFAGILQVRVNHDAVYEYYCLDNKDPTKIPSASSIAYTTSLIEKGLNRHSDHMSALKNNKLSMPPLELVPKKGGNIGMGSNLDAGDLLRLLSVAHGQHDGAELGDWIWMSAQVGSRCPNINMCMASWDGKYVLTGETVGGSESGKHVDLPEQDELLFLNLSEEEAAMLVGSKARDAEHTGKNKDRDDDDDDDDDDRDRSKPLEYSLSVWRIAEGTLARRTLGKHDLMVSGICVLPMGLVPKVGCPSEDDYALASGSADETVRFWSYHQGALDSNATDTSGEVQIVERPHFLRLLLASPALAQQGVGPRYVGIDTEITAEGKAKQLISATQRKYQELLHERQQKAMMEAAEKAIHRAATLSADPTKNIAPAGQQIKQLDKIIQLRSGDTK